MIRIDKDLEEIMPMFLDNRRKDLIQLSEALSIKDFKIIETIAHKLAGNAGSYGLSHLSELGTKLEVAAMQQKEDDMINLITEYQQFMNTLQITFE